MRERIAYIIASGALLLVGAGCGGAVEQDISAGINAQIPGDEATIKEEGDLEIEAEGSVDASVDDLLDDAEEEKTNEAESEKDADEVSSDKAGVNAYMESNYEIK